MTTRICTILGGPNGSGKSSLYRVIDPPGEFVNADLVARRINPADPEAASLAAGRAVLERLDELIEAGRNFVYETTLSSHQAINLMRRARASSYQVALIFVALAHETAVFDNSEAMTHLLLRIAGDVIEENHLDRVKRLHGHIAKAVAQALGIEVGEVFRAGRSV